MESIHDLAALDRRRAEARIEPGLVRQLLNAFYKKHQTRDQSLQQLSERARQAFQSDVSFHTLELSSRHDSRLDGATKLIFRTASGHLLESVILRIGTGRTTLCVSSQVGCAVRCGFCATGQMGLLRNLSQDEILDQVVQANQILSGEGRSVRNVVFMGMGEPFQNEGPVYQALEGLLSPRCFGLSASHLVVSTVGIPDAMVRFAARFPRVRLALSLHSARQERRERIIPLARRFTLEMLRPALAEVTRMQQQPVMIEYLMLAGLNDSDDDLHELSSYLRNLPVHVNLIPYNAIEATTAGLVGTGVERRREFAASLTAAGFPVTIRYSLGADIAAACGQLVQRQPGSLKA